MPSVTVAQLRALAPHGLPHILSAIADASERVFAKRGMTKLPHVHMFVAQTAEETGGFTVLQENLHYSAERAHEVWPSKFPTAAAAAPYVGNPQTFAEKVYGGRKDLGNTEPGDGWKYRGTGLLQTTGRAWAAKLQGLTGLPLVDQPELAISDAHMLEVAVANFTSYPGILGACERYDLRTVTHLVNGGYINLATRQQYLSAARRAIITLGAGQVAHDPVLETSVPAVPPLAGVRLLQDQLNRLGASPKLDLDGDFGDATEAAVRVFQRAHGLTVDGKAGKLTLAAIAAALAAPVAAAPAAAVPPVPAAHPTVLRRLSTWLFGARAGAP